MSDTNIDLLSCHPTNPVVNQLNESYSGKDKFRNTKPIPGAKLRVHTVYQRGEYRGASWDALLPSLDDDYLRLDAPTNKPNPRAAWMLDVEADGADYFKQEISAPVLSKFTEYPQLFNQSEMAPPEGRSGKFIDTVFYWKEVSDTPGDKKRVAFVGDFKRNVLIPQLWLEGSIEKNVNQKALSQELRGLAIEYECPQIFCFDMNAYLFLQFRAEKPSELSKPECLVDCWVFRRAESDAEYLAEPIRNVLYKFIVQGIRRSQCYGFPIADVDGLTATKRRFFSGEPLWRRADGKLAPQHPSDCHRSVDERDGALAWKSSDGQWLLDYNGGKVYDSLPLWWPEEE